ncbi:transposase [Candidatus Thiosymbion oneisti]|uniref:transposase n=1 Tax=Candidatus Thiosymbion oneisti TaxID=589554 RepID=UPI0013FE1B04|nr:transposase [Candidatus Thiosymbion oneisti]
MARRYKRGVARAQEALLPPRVEDYVSETNLVRAIDAYVDTLDLPALGFTKSGGDLTPGQPAFDPGLRLKLYLYGDLNRVRSSRRLERECRRNLELIWRLEGLVPSYRTSAEFRRVNGTSRRAANRDFVLLCRELDLVGGETIGIDGSFFQASASDASITTKKDLEAQLKKIERDLEAYTQSLDANDAHEAQVGDGLAEDPALAEKLQELKERQARKPAQRERLEASGETQFSRTDPAARALSKGKQPVTGDNMQSCVDDKHKLIVSDEVSNEGNDQNQLSGQCRAAMEIMAVNEITAVADSGYYSEAQLAACQEANATVYVPIPDQHKVVTD